MKTKLEMMAGYLAGRRDESADLIRQELGDPASEACRFLEAMREKSRGALEVNPPRRPDYGPAARGPIARAFPKPARLPVTVVALVVSPLLIAVGAAWWAHDQRLRGIEASLSRGDEGWEGRVRRLETAVARGAECGRVGSWPVWRRPWANSSDGSGKIMPHDWIQTIRRSLDCAATSMV